MLFCRVSVSVCVGRLWGEIRRCIWASVTKEVCGGHVKGGLQEFGGYILRCLWRTLGVLVKVSMW